MRKKSPFAQQLAKQRVDEGTSGRRLSVARPPSEGATSEFCTPCLSLTVIFYVRGLSMVVIANKYSSQAPLAAWRNARLPLAAHLAAAPALPIDNIASRTASSARTESPRARLRVVPRPLVGGIVRAMVGGLGFSHGHRRALETRQLNN